MLCMLSLDIRMKQNCMCETLGMFAMPGTPSPKTASAQCSCWVQLKGKFRKPRPKWKTGLRGTLMVRASTSRCSLTYVCGLYRQRTFFNKLLRNIEKKQKNGKIALIIDSNKMLKYYSLALNPNKLFFDLFIAHLWTSVWGGPWVGWTKKDPT